ncbi:MAG TPA: PqqD family protein, partial [Actinobacteria bacterium]|nr:PqqD family protein [Actinomycetota bacterium]
TGAFIWELCISSCHTSDSIIDELVTHFKIKNLQHSDIRSDVEGFLDDLSELNFILSSEPEQQ